MRCLASSTCLLLQIITMLAMFVSVFANKTSCLKLNEKVDLFIQMANCTGKIFSFSSANSVFDLSELDQATADVILFNKKSNGVPDPTNPKEFAGHIKIVGSKLERLTLIMSIGNGEIKQPKVEIINNMKLEFLKIGSDITLNLVLKGNRQLSKESIRNVKKVSEVNQETSEFQEYQECSFIDGIVKTLADLEGCSNIGGDLIINDQTAIPDPMPFIEIRKIRKGCLQIENSKLKIIDFLEGLLDGKSKAECTGQSYIKGNTELCMTSEDRLKWSKVFTLHYAGKCPDRCTVKFAEDNQDKTKAPCDVVIGDVRIIGSPSATDLAHWDRVKVLEGTLEVDGTNLEDIAIFKNLEKIVNPSPEKIALVVIKNQKMTKFDLPKLKNITMPPGAMSQPIFFQKNNPKFEFSSDESKKWNRITGQKKLLIPVKLEEKKKETSTNKNTKKYWIMGLAGTFSTLISLGMVGGAVFYAKRDFKKVEKIAKRRRAAKKRRSRKIGNRKTGSRTTGKGKTGRKRRRSKIRRKRKNAPKSRSGKK